MSDGCSDFDFLHGSWSVRHRRLAARLAGSSDWVEFGGTMECRPLLGGPANVDDNVIDLPDGSYRAVTLRWFNPASASWTIHWIDGRTPRLDPPVIGRFDDGAGRFIGEDELAGRPIKVRFLWDGITPQSARWQQSFAWADEGDWETNWIMEFGRTA